MSAYICSSDIKSEPFDKDDGYGEGVSKSPRNHILIQTASHKPSPWISMFYFFVAC